MKKRWSVQIKQGYMDWIQGCRDTRPAVQVRDGCGRQDAGSKIQEEIFEIAEGIVFI